MNRRKRSIKFSSNLFIILSRKRVTEVLACMLGIYLTHVRATVVVIGIDQDENNATEDKIQRNV